MSIGDFLDYSGFGEINFLIIPIILFSIGIFSVAVELISGKTTMTKTVSIVLLVISIILLIGFIILFNMTGGIDMMINNHWIELAKISL